MNEGNVPPHDLDAEAAVLSAVLVDVRALDAVLDFLKAEHFYSEAHRRIFEGCLELHRVGAPIDTVQVSSWLRSRGRLEQVGGLAYLAQILDVAPAVNNAHAYATTLREKWRVRQLIAACQRAAAEGYGDFGDAQTFIDRTEQAVYTIARTPEGSNVRAFVDIMKESFAKISAAGRRGQLTGTSTGFDRYDRITAGLHPGELTIVAARPGMGKTSFVLNVATNAARPCIAPPLLDDPPPRCGVLIFSLEMPREQIINRILCCEARINVSKLREASYTTEEWSRLTAISQDLATMPVWVDDTSGINLLEIRAKVRRLQAEYDEAEDGVDPGRRIGLVIIDYLQLMSGRENANNREQQISEISRGLKGLAKELSLPVMALSQLNRGVENRTEKAKRPQISDLRESGAIEQDADNIVFIYRDDYYNKDSTERGVAELIVAKQRNGPTATARVKWLGEYTRFDNLPEGEFGDGEHYR